MNFDYVIIQAGGEGTRLGHLTKNKPKAIVPVNNLPIIFHLFQKYPDKKFIIIGDYKFDVLKRYLRVFANVEYMLVHASGKGNGAGVKQALGFIPEEVPFMLVWSDLLLADDFSTEVLEDGNYVALSGDFSCSWRFENGVLEKIPSTEHGVAGMFLFDKKSYFKELSSPCRFTKWLQDSGMVLKELPLKGAVEVGTPDAIRKVDPGENRCRPYNHMEFTETTVKKTGLTAEGKKLIERETEWYREVSLYGFKQIPRIISYNPLVMERIHGNNIFKENLSDEQKMLTIDRLVQALDALHHMNVSDIDYFDLQEDYFNKTMKRLSGIREAIPFADREYISINGRKCKNVFYFQNELEEMVHDRLFDTEFGPIHGDCTLTNTMIDKDGNLFFIDARGYFGKRKIVGDVYYDWAKLYYSVAGSFDQFNIKNFDMDILEDEIRFKIFPGGWEHLTEYFLGKIPDCDVVKVKLIHAIVWMSLASHCWEDYDSLCLAFYNGLYLWNELL